MNGVQLDNICKIHKKRLIFLSTPLLEFFVKILYNFYGRMLTRAVKSRVGLRKRFFAGPTHMGVEERRRQLF